MDNTFLKGSEVEEVVFEKLEHSFDPTNSGELDYTDNNKTVKGRKWNVLKLTQNFCMYYNNLYVKVI